MLQLLVRSRLDRLRLPETPPATQSIATSMPSDCEVSSAKDHGPGGFESMLNPDDAAIAGGLDDGLARRTPRA